MHLSSYRADVRCDLDSSNDDDEPVVTNVDVVNESSCESLSGTSESDEELEVWYLAQLFLFDTEKGHGSGTISNYNHYSIL